MPKPTEEQIIKILNTVAHKLSKQYSYKYEVDELVNEVWLMGRVQQIPDVKMVWMRARFDMMDYIRYYSTWRYQDKPKGIDVRVIKKRFSLPDTTIDENDQIDFLTKNLPQNEILSIKLLAEGYTIKEAAGLVGYTQSWLSLKLLGKLGMLRNDIINRYCSQNSD